jgi:hypothetical protein
MVLHASQNNNCEGLASCVHLHDMHASMLRAIKALQQSEDDEPKPWKDLQSRWCMCPMGRIFTHQCP